MVYLPQADNTNPVLDNPGYPEYHFGMNSTAKTKARPRVAPKPNFLAAHRKAAGLSQAELADAVGTSQNQISRLENEKRGVNLDWLRRIAKALGVSEQQLFQEPDIGVNDKRDRNLKPVDNLETIHISSIPNAEMAAQTVRTQSRRYIDVLGRAAGGREGKFILNGERIDRFLCPPSMEASSNPYAIQIVGTSMEPRYEDGELVLVNPDMPYRQGSYVVAQLLTDEEGVFECYAKRFISFNSKELVLEQLNPPKSADRVMRFPAARVRAIHKLVGPDGK